MCRGFSCAHLREEGGILGQRLPTMTDLRCAQCCPLIWLLINLVFIGHPLCPCDNHFLHGIRSPLKIET